MNAELTVFLVDDQADVRTAMSRMLTMAGWPCRAFATATEFLASGCADARGCLLLDMTMPDMDGAALQRALNERRSCLPIIFLTGHPDLDSGISAMKAGANDFLTKPVDSARLLCAIDAAMAQGERMRQHASERVLFDQRLGGLTPRERDVLALVVSGKMNKQTAKALGIAEKTVKTHRARVMAKMQVRTVAELVQLCQRGGARF